MPPLTSSALHGKTLTVAASFLCLMGTLYYLDIPSLLQNRLQTRKVTPRCYSTNDKPSLTAFRVLVEQQIALRETYPLAKDIQKNIPIYDCSRINLSDERQIERLQDEWFHILSSGPGVLTLKGFFSGGKIEAIDAANAAYEKVIARELQIYGSQGDHFAAAGTNSRIWNAFSKFAIQNPQAFVQYYSNPFFHLISTAYLGPASRLTSQVNIVKPGGKAQVAHRDYHLGFQTVEDVARWPKALHHASRYLTLQGAVAHTDMPLESGPTRFLPFSQTFEEGYMAYRLPDFSRYFEENWVSLPLEKGDAVFFSPALFHAAGENTTQNFERSANLIQVSSAFGKTMETIDDLPIVNATYEFLRAKFDREGWNGEVDAFVRMVEGYPFPTNLDQRPPAPGGMAPESAQDLLRKAVMEGWSREDVLQAMRKMQADSSA